MSLESKNHHIISSGTVCTFEDEPVSIRFGPPSALLEVVFSFIETENKKMGHKVKGEGKKLEIELENFNNDLGTGSTKPMKIGMFQEKTIFLNFRVYALGESKSKLIHFTIYQEK